MAHTVLRVPSVGRVVAAMSRRERQAYDAAVQALKGEGCRAGGKRLAAIDDANYPMCQRALYGDRRMTTIYRPPPDSVVVIISVARHTERESPNAALAEIFPGLSAEGRRRSEQPPCCDDPQTPPTLSAELDSILFELFDARGSSPPAAGANARR